MGSIMENPAALQTTQPGNTSDSLLAILLLMQAVHRWSDSITKIWHFDPWAMFPAPLDILRLKFPVQMVAVMLDFLPCALHWVAHLTDGLVEHPNSVRFWMREVQNDFCIFYLVAGWPGLDKGTLFLVLHVWNSDTHHSLSLQEIGYFRASNSRRHAFGMLSWAGSSQRPCERRTYNQ